jgi:hypothetical protein
MGDMIAIDGTQKFYLDEQWEEECLSRKVGIEEKKAVLCLYTGSGINSG